MQPHHSRPVAAPAGCTCTVDLLHAFEGADGAADVGDGRVEARCGHRRRFEVDGDGTVVCIDAAHHAERDDVALEAGRANLGEALTDVVNRDHVVVSPAVAGWHCSQGHSWRRVS